MIILSFSLEINNKPIRVSVKELQKRGKLNDSLSSHSYQSNSQMAPQFDRSNESSHNKPKNAQNLSQRGMLHWLQDEEDQDDGGNVENNDFTT